ncbi:MAG: VOC family protein [Acidimicrobiia bacterium]|nr:VOC family protein [Acidimicrobiia bacterium]
MGKVAGIGGVFLDSNDAPALADWYRRHLEIEFETHPDNNSFYVVFRTRDLVSGEIRQNPVFAINQTDTTLAPPHERGVTVNLRVDDLERTLSRLAVEGVSVDEQRIAWEGGKHGWIRDLDGNRLELYEELPLPADSPYR